jgi:hypothetical protein
MIIVMIMIMMMAIIMIIMSVKGRLGDQWQEGEGTRE